MILKNVPSSILVALGLGCGPSVEDDTSTSACLSPVSLDDDGTDVGPCLSECLGMLPTTDDGTTTSGDDSDVGPCLDTSGGCLSPPQETGTSTDSDSTGGFISASSDTSGDSDSGTTGNESGSDSGSDSGGTSGGTDDASPRARSWRAALQRMEDGGTLPSDVLARLRAQKGPR